MASLARCWFAVAKGVGGAEVDGLEDVEDVAASARARSFVALVAAVARDRCRGVVMVAVLREEEEDEPSSPVRLAFILATAALPCVPGCGGGTCGCWARCASGRKLRGGGGCDLVFYVVQKYQNQLQSEILLFLSNSTIRSIFSGVSPPPHPPNSKFSSP